MLKQCEIWGMLIYSTVWHIQSSAWTDETNRMTTQSNKVAYSIDSKLVCPPCSSPMYNLEFVGALVISIVRVNRSGIPWLKLGNKVNTWTEADVWTLFPIHCSYKATLSWCPTGARELCRLWADVRQTQTETGIVAPAETYILDRKHDVCPHD